MSEVLGDAEPYDELAGLPSDDYDEYDEPPARLAGPWTAVSTPGSLAISSLTLSGLSLFGPFAGYLITNAVEISRAQSSSVFQGRVAAVVELAIALVAAALGVLAHRSISRLDEPATARVPHMLAGAGILLGTFSALLSAVSLVILAMTHVSGVPGN